MTRRREFERTSGLDRRQFHAALLGALVRPRTEPLSAEPRVDGARLAATLERLAQFGRNPQGGVSRTAYSQADLDARAYVLDLMKQAGLATSTDAGANLVGRRAGSAAGLAPLVIGSHIDTVPEGGNYDGCVGSMAAIEVARTIQGAVPLRHPLEVVIFSNEEGGHLGSRAITGGLLPRDFEQRAAGGRTVREGIRLLGGDPDGIARAVRPPGSIAAFLELHVEQGGTLDRQ
jgi:N-carbamoyl-L-amino-acid hydrolase